MKADEVINNLKVMATIYPHYSPTLEEAARLLEVRLKESSCLRTTNDAAIELIFAQKKEIERLQGALDDAGKGYQEIKALLDDIHSAAQDKDTLT